MKKLIVACSTLLCAVAVNAASCVWSATNIPVASATDTITSYMAYLCDASVMTSSTLATAIAAGNGASAIATEGLVQKSTSVTSAGGVTQVGVGTYTAGTEYTMYMLVLDASDVASADNYFVTTDVTQTAPTAGYLMMAFGSQASANWQAIPEPTSGMLLLVGCALMALKRKRA